MSLPAFIPPEIIQKILSQLRGNSQALQTTSLVAQDFLHPSQQLLFSDIDLIFSPRHESGLRKAKQLLVVFQSNSQLPLYVRSLIFRNETTWLGMEDILPAIFAMLTNIHAIVLHLGSPWESLEHTVRRALLKLLGQRSLIDVTLRNAMGFPSEHALKRLPQLKRLALYIVMRYPRDDPDDLAWFEPESVASEVFVKGQLEFLVLDHGVTWGTTIEKLLDSLLDANSRLGINELRAFRINGDGSKHRKIIRSILEIVSETLECLIWDAFPGVAHSGSVGKSPIEVTKLKKIRCLGLSFPLNTPSIKYPANTSWIINSLYQLQEKDHLEELILVLYPSSKADEAPDMEGWPSQLDICLNQGDFPRLSKVCIYLALILPYTEESIIRGMPYLQTSGVLTVGRLATVESVDTFFDNTIRRILGM